MRGRVAGAGRDGSATDEEIPPERRVVLAKNLAGDRAGRSVGEVALTLVRDEVAEAAVALAQDFVRDDPLYGSADLDLVAHAHGVAAVPWISASLALQKDVAKQAVRIMPAIIVGGFAPDCRDSMHDGSC